MAIATPTRRRRRVHLATLEGEWNVPADRLEIIKQVERGGGSRFRRMGGKVCHEASSYEVEEAWTEGLVRLWLEHDRLEGRDADWAISQVTSYSM